MTAADSPPDHPYAGPSDGQRDGQRDSQRDGQRDTQRDNQHETPQLSPKALPQPLPDTLPHTLPDTLPDSSQLVLRVMPLPADVNANGDIFGGWIMAQVDLAGAVLPSRIAKGRIATVAVNQFVFKQPVSLGDLLSFYARVTRIGNTSISVHVEVFAERNPANLHVVKVTEADLTYVAIDAQGQPRPVPK